ncbi:MAG: hypothetical protein R3F46_14040 [bacterium]
MSKSIIAMLVILVLLVAALLVPIMQMSRWDPQLREQISTHDQQSAGADAPLPAGEPQNVATLGSADELAQEFSADNGRLRLLAILSPTTESSRQAAGYIQQELLQAHEDIDISVYVVWITQRSGDTLEQARQASGLLSDTRARHYYSSDAAGSYVADALGYPGDKVWNCIMLFGEEAVWDPEMPAPQRVLQQLGAQHWLGEQNYATGNDLRNALAALGAELGSWQF